MKSLVLSIHTELKSFMELIYCAVVSTDSKLIGIRGTNFAKEIRKMRRNRIIILLLTAHFIALTLRE